MLFHRQATRPHEIDPLRPLWQHMLWSWTAKKGLRSGNLEPFD